MNSFDRAYLDVLEEIEHKGFTKGDRTGTGTISRFGTQARFSLKDNRIPMISLRKVFHRSFIHETLWFLSGSTDIEYLKKNNVSIWDSWVKPETAKYRELSLKERSELLSEKGRDAIDAYVDHIEEIRGRFGEMKDLTPQVVDLHHHFLDKYDIPRQVLVSGSIGDGAYGSQWRAWDDTRIVDYAELDSYLERGFEHVGETNNNIGTVVSRKIDQIANIVELLKNEPDSRRILLVAYNPSRVEDCVLPPCFQPGTLISTPDGYRKIEEIKEGDIVYSASMTPRKVNKVWKTDYSGELVAIRQPYSPFPLISTPNHPHYVEGKGYIAAENIKTGDSMLIPCRNNAVELKPHSFYYKLGGKEYRHTLSKNDYFTLGYFLGNGWFMENSGNRVCFAIPETKKNYILPIIRETVKVSRKRTKSKTVSTYETRSLKWSYLLPDFGKHAHNKQIPEWIFNSPIEFIEEFLKGYLEADGNLGPEEGGYTFVTTSLKIAYGLQRLWSLFERPCGITYQSRPETTIIEGRVVKQRSTYTVRVSHKAQLTSNSYSDKGMSVMVEDTMYLRTVNRIQVYNLDVEEEHTYIANNYATHNCHSFAQWWTRELDVKERAKLLSKEQMEEYGTFVYNTLEGDYGDAKARELFVKWFDERNVPSRALSCHLYMRSNDVGVGAVFNIPQYGLLTHMLAQVTGMIAEELIWTNGDSHIYLNHAEGLNELFSREGHIEEARVKLNPEITRIDDFKFEDIKILNYEHDPVIRFPVAV